MRTLAIALLALVGCASEGEGIGEGSSALEPAALTDKALAHRYPEAENDLIAHLAGRTITLRAEIALTPASNGLVAAGYIGHVPTPFTIQTGRILSDVSCTLTAAGTDATALEAGTAYAFFPDVAYVDDTSAVTFGGDATAGGGGVRFECSAVDTAGKTQPTYYFDF